MTTWDQARQIVDQELRSSWSAAWPELTFRVAEWGYVDGLAFQVPYGAREHLVDGDDAAAIVGELAALVDRVTGELELELVSFPSHLDRLDTWSASAPGTQGTNPCAPAVRDATGGACSAASGRFGSLAHGQGPAAGAPAEAAEAGAAEAARCLHRPSDSPPHQV